ncbi:alpha/beta hydrolase [Aquilutibacter rugosus]|uniref:alpha/beta hydrolase n=1 Tax=Aquilutibacter rugosus TaxID=3115820 RepID=UPI002F42D6D1
MSADSVRVDGPIGPLEAIFEGPETDAVAQPVVAVICHPLSTEGGSLHNKVVTMTARALRESGVATVRFNFRSVGASVGSFDHGEGESDDLAAVVAEARQRFPGYELWLAGFSFGAYVAIRNARRLDAKYLISIAPPVGRSWDFKALELPQCPWLIIQGDADEIVDPAKVYDWVESLQGLAEPPELVKVPETTHFFHRRLMDLRGVIKHSIKRYLPGA